MKLIDFLIDNSIFADDYISLLKFQTYFETLNKQQKFTFLNLNYESDFKDIENEVEIIISLNPDCDFPPPKKHIYLEKSLNTDEGKDFQKALDKMDYYSKLQLDIIDKIPKNIKKIYCNSVGYNIKEVNMIPIGRDFKNEHLFNITNKYSRNNKSILCYYNCTLPPNCTHWYGLLRKDIYEICKKKAFIHNHQCIVHPRNHFHKNDIELYFKTLSQSKFMICPRGCGIDTYRLWDCIFMGCIPIVEKYDGYTQFEDLPIVLINNWRDIETLTEKFLEDKWEEMLNKDYNYDKLTMDYWVKKIESS